MEEIWKDIIGYEGIYKVSNLGRVKSLGRLCGFYFRNEEKILNGFIKPDGYKAIDLYNKDNKKSKFYIHRLVAEAFIPNPENKSEVNHKDENKLNNTVDNLEWCTSSENKRSGTCLERASNTRDVKNVNMKPVIQYDLDGNYINEFRSIKEASEFTKINGHTIYNQINKKNKPRLYIWEIKK